MRHGLGLVDLNLRAQMALAGFSRTPEADICILLRSGQPIEEATRQKLADALDGRSASLALRARNKSPGKSIRALELRRERLKIGRAVDALVGSLGYEAAVEKGASEYKVSEKSIIAHLAFARRVESEIGRLREATRAMDLSDYALELVILYAEATKQRPKDCLRLAASHLPNLVASFDDLKAAAKGIMG